FQAEDGIRDDLVTGVQTCALPIYRSRHCRDVDLCHCHQPAALAPALSVGRAALPLRLKEGAITMAMPAILEVRDVRQGFARPSEIGRASCRERVEIAGGAGARTAR